MIKILIIEDEPAMRSNLADLLELEGFCPLAAANGREGVDLARRELPELVLCDVLMTDLDGHDVLLALRADKETARIPFIFLTAKGERADVRQGMTLGADDYLVKPVPVNELLAAIRTRLERHQEQQAVFKPEFSSPKPLEQLGLTPREADILFWAAQGKTNAEIAIIFDLSPATVKKHLEHIFEKTGTENRQSAALRAIEVLGAHTLAGC